MKTLKILVAGHFNAGKTTFVNTASNIKTVSTEKSVSHSKEKTLKSKTTTAMDYGETTIGMDKVSIFGIPGQERFSFMWKILSKNTHGFIFLLDSTAPDMWADTLKQIDTLANGSNIPYIIAANKQDLPKAWGVSAIRKHLDIPGDIHILPCVAKDQGVVVENLKVLLHKIEQHQLGGVKV